MRPFASNIRRWLCDQDISHSQWEQRVAGWLPETRESNRRASALLTDSAMPLLEEIQAIAAAMQVDEETLAHGDLGDPNKTLERNIRYLFDQIEHGKKNVVYETISVVASTVSRWTRGEKKPSKKNLEAIKKYFGIPPEIDLNEIEIYCTDSPLTPNSKRQWLEQRIKDIPDQEIIDLYPALHRILRKIDETP